MNASKNYPGFYRLVYDTINGYTPLAYDCGTLCGKACCSGDQRQGMYLFPHEEEALDLTKFTTAESDGRIFVTCNGECTRENRPLACRMFPFLPSVSSNGLICVKPDAGAFKLCPCLQHIDVIRFDKGFLRALRRAGRILTADADCRAYLKELTAENDPLLHMILPQKPRNLIRKQGK